MLKNTCSIILLDRQQVRPSTALFNSQEHWEEKQVQIAPLRSSQSK